VFTLIQQFIQSTIQHILVTNIKNMATCFGSLNHPQALLPSYLLPSYLLTPHSKVLLEKLTGLKLIKKFPPFYGTRRFITAFTSARYLSLS